MFHHQLLRANNTDSPAFHRRNRSLMSLNLFWQGMQHSRFYCACVLSLCVTASIMHVPTLNILVMLQAAATELKAGYDQLSTANSHLVETTSQQKGLFDIQKAAYDKLQVGARGPKGGAPSYHCHLTLQCLCRRWTPLC
jgi:hypothetical protein